MRTQTMTFALTLANPVFAFDAAGDPFLLSHFSPAGSGTYGASGFIIQDTGVTLEYWNALNPGSTFATQALFDAAATGTAGSMWVTTSIAGPAGGGQYAALAGDGAFKCYSPLGRVRLRGISTASLLVHGQITAFRGAGY